MKKVLILLSIFLGLLLLHPQVAHALNNENLIRAKLNNLQIRKTIDYFEINGNIEGSNFNYTGQIYKLVDNKSNSKLYFVENYEKNSNLMLINLEFDLKAKIDELEIHNKNLVGKQVVRLTILKQNVYYYCEQSYLLPDIVLIDHKTIDISKIDSTNEEILNKIKANSAWYYQLNSIPLSQRDEKEVKTFAYPPINFDKGLRQKDIDMIKKEGYYLFTSPRNEWWVSQNVGNPAIRDIFFINSMNWPQGTNYIRSAVIRLDFTTNVPDNTNDYASIQATLNFKQCYMYNPDSNTISFELSDPDRRIYNMSLGIQCGKRDIDSYDYIFMQSNYINSSYIPNGDIALSLLNLFDKYNIISSATNFFDAISKAKSVKTFSMATWPSNYYEHYSNNTLGKDANKMLRGVSFATKGHLLKNEDDYMLLQIRIADKDFENSNQSEILKKALIYGISFELREPTIFGYTFGGKTIINVNESCVKYYEK